MRHQTVHHGGQLLAGERLEVPKEPRVQRLFIQRGLQVDGHAHVLQLLRHAAGQRQRQRPADSKVGKEHLALLVVEVLFLLSAGLPGPQRHIFEGKPRKRGRPALPRLDGNQRRQRLLNAVPRLLCERIAVSGGAGQRIARAAGAQDHRIGPDTLTVLQDRAAAPSDLDRQMRDAGFIVNPHAQPLQLPPERSGHVAGVIGDRKDPVSTLHLQRNAKLLHQFHHVAVVKGRERRVHEARVAHHLPEEVLRLSGVGQVAAALSGDVYFLAQLFVALDERDRRAASGRKERSQHAGCASADYQDSSGIHFTFSPRSVRHSLRDTRRTPPKSFPSC